MASNRTGIDGMLGDAVIGGRRVFDLATSVIMLDSMRRRPQRLRSSWQRPDKD